MVKPVGEKPKPQPDLLFSSLSPGKKYKLPPPPSPNCRVVWWQESPWVTGGQLEGGLLMLGKGAASSPCPQSPTSLQTGAANTPSLNGGNGMPRVPLKNVYDTVHTQIFAECPPCTSKPRAMVGFSPEAVSLQIRASSWCWGAPHCPPGPWQR